ncbi:MAG TPA: hypothetical protein VIG88_12170 [Lysobacter sp.]
MKRLFAIAALFASTAAGAASFDCGKAGTFVEKEICTSLVLGRLDEALADNYRMMLASDIGADARAQEKARQKAWLAERNRCRDYACIERAYRRRVDAICEVPVLGGVHPPCTLSEDVDW